MVEFPSHGHLPLRSHPYGLMDEDVFMMSESMVEIQVLFFVSSATLDWGYNGTHAGLVADADAVVVSQRAIEGESRLRACTHVMDRDVVTKER